MGHDTTVEIEGAVYQAKDQVVMTVKSPTLTAPSDQYQMVKVQIGDETATVYAKDLIEAAEKARA